MKIIVCVRDLKWGIGRHVIKFIQVLEKSKEVEKILLVSTDRVKIFGDKVEIKTIRLRGKTFLVKEPLFAWKCTRLVKDLLKKETYHLVDVRQPVLLSRLSIPVVYNVHVTHFQFSREARNRRSFFLVRWLHGIYQWFDKLQFRWADRIIFVSRRTLGEFEKKYRQFSRKALYIPNFRDTDIFCRLEKSRIEALREAMYMGEENFLILYCGRLDKMKNIPSLLDAVGRLKQRYPQLILLVAGDGRLRERVKRDDNALYLGRLDPHRLNELYNLSDLTVLPSFYENFPGVVLESIAAGTPVISTDVGDVKDLLPPDFIIEGFSPEAIARKIETVLQMDLREKERALSRLRKRMAAVHDARKNSREKLAVYRELIRQSRPQG